MIEEADKKCTQSLHLAFLESLAGIGGGQVATKVLSMVFA